ncbi:hypothetical protein SASPL_128800 [Salvia splendens]|uniref:Uncharacterized protein n=1 Tax=Salvia splendens TaxID=180675 RepID=A0A8X8XEV0_SALSN|nr:hypothetical protein SASPL_128800 [Salvia splendens]
MRGKDCNRTGYGQANGRQEKGKEYRWGDVTLKLGEDKGFCKRATLGEMGVKIIPGRNDTIWLGKATQKSVEIVDTTCPWVA